jgi:hypothetical protein
MATARLPGRVTAARAPTPASTPGRARPVAGPLVPSPVPAALTARTPLTRLSAEELIAQIERCEAASAGNSYALGACLKELSQPKRYREELGFAKFEELLIARSLPSRMTAFKLISVVSIYSEPEVRQLGGMAKSYALVRFAKRATGVNSDPRRFLAANARLLGTPVIKLSVRDINGAARGPSGEEEPAPEQTSAEKKAAKKASSQLGRALKRAGLKHRMRIHFHGDECVAAHFAAPAATELATMLTRLRKLEKPKKPT